MDQFMSSRTKHLSAKTMELSARDNIGQEIILTMLSEANGPTDRHCRQVSVERRGYIMDGWAVPCICQLVCSSLGLQFIYCLTFCTPSFLL